MSSRGARADPPPTVSSVSFAVLTRNRWPIADRCLSGLLEQTRPRGVPVVVLVNGSDDDSADRIRNAYPDVEVHETEDNLGCPGGRNRLTEMCRTGWVAFIDDDGTVGPGFVDALLREVEQAPVSRMVIAGCIIDPDVNPDATFTSGPVGRFSGGVCAIRRADFLRLGGYPADGLRQGEEGALSLRLHDAGLSIHRSADLVLHHPLRHDEPKRRELLRTGLRQSLLTGVTSCPWWMVPFWIVWKLAVNLRLAVRLRSPGPFLGGVGDAARDLPGAVRARRPVSARAVIAASSRFGGAPRSSR